MPAHSKTAKPSTQVAVTTIFETHLGRFRPKARVHGKTRHRSGTLARRGSAEALEKPEDFALAQQGCARAKSH